jgi:hypothetical protein
MTTKDSLITQAEKHEKRGNFLKAERVYTELGDQKNAARNRELHIDFGNDARNAYKRVRYIKLRSDIINSIERCLKTMLRKN